MKYLRVAYAGEGMEIDNYPTTNTVSHCQFTKCDIGLALIGQDISLRNNLFYHCPWALVGVDAAVHGENLTVNQSSLLLYEDVSSSLRLTNTLLIAVTNIGNNGFTNYNATNSNFVWLTNDPGVFQTVGAASHYLSGNTYRNVGTTNIDSGLLNALKTKTTYAPTLITNDFTSDTILARVVQRDIDTPDLGYHYDSLDYAISNRSISGATLTLTNGVAVGFYEIDDPDAPSGSLHLGCNSVLVSEGSPTNLNRLVWYNTVQEQASTNWISRVNTFDTLSQWDFDCGGMAINCRFTDFSRLAGPGGHIGIGDNGWEGKITLRDCQFHGGANYFWAQYAYNGFTNAVTNCLFERNNVVVYGRADSAVNESFYNNLFYQSPLSLDASDVCSGSFIFKDNFFHTTNLTQTTNLTLTCGYNAYLTNAAPFVPTSANDVTNLVSFVFTNGALGKYYQISTNLIDKGSRSATNAGLYQYTTTTNQAKEDTSTVDIGFHYVAAGSDAAPIDSNGDGTPDYLADANGNGAEDVAETPWARPHIIQQPQTRVDRAGTNAIFTVTAAGVAPLSYQWQKTGTNLSDGGNISGAATTTLTVAAATNIDVGPYTVVVSNSYGAVTSSIVKLLLIPDWIGPATHTWSPSIGGGVWYQRKSTLDAIAGAVATNYPRPVLIGLRSDVAEEGYRFDLNTFAVDLYNYSNDLCSQECVLQSLSTNTEFIWSMPVPTTNSLNNYYTGSAVPTGDGFPWQKPVYYAAYLQYLIEKTNMSQSQIDSLTNSNYSFWTDTNCTTADTNVAQLLHTNWANLRGKRGHPEPYKLKAVILGVEPYSGYQERTSGGSDYGNLASEFRGAIRGRGHGFSTATGQTSELSKIPLGLHVDSSGKPPSYFGNDAQWFKPMLDSIIQADPLQGITSLADFSYLDMYHYYEGGQCYSNIPCSQADKWDHRFPTILKADGSAWVYPYYNYASSNWPPGVDYSRYLWMFGDAHVALTNYVDPQYGQHDTNLDRWQIGCAEHGIYVQSGTNGDDMAGGIHWGLWLSEAMWFNTTWDENWVFAEQKGSHAQLLWTYDSRTNYLTNHLTRTPGHYVYSMAQEFYGYQHHSNSFISSFITDTNYSGEHSTNPVAYVSPEIVTRSFLNTNDGHYHLWVINQNATNAYTNSDWQQWSIPYWKQLHADSPTDWNPIAEDWHPETITNKSISYTGPVTNFVIPPLSVNHIELSP